MAGWRSVFVSHAGWLLARIWDFLAYLAPKGLYARALIIIIAPIVLLEGVVAFVFMERHWQAVTRRLSEATARDVAAVIELYKRYDRGDNYRSLTDLARDRLALSVQVLPAGDLPPAQPKPFFSILDRALSNEIRLRIPDTPFWIDTVGDSDHVEIKVKLDKAIISFLAQRSQTYASNSHIFLVWMVVTSVILLTVAILFLRNQIRPILRLAEAADAFGKGRPIPDDFRPRGAREVRQAAMAFVEMRDRITQHVDQRTAMLAGVSHDLRTILTRFKLELAMLDGAEVAGLRKDVDEMQHMLEEYLAFAKGDGGEEARPTKLRELLEEIRDEAIKHRIPLEFKQSRRRREVVVLLKRQAIKRAITNLVSNAGRFSSKVVLRASTARKWVIIEVEDNGPGIPAGERENVFRPFYRLDHARNQDNGNTGLGLAITRDIARSHGGDVTLGDSSIGGLRAVIRIPV
ncbi:MAG: HAMP domain-containing protein [Hyphomicrobiaceae bacterium]|nr:HAMP domain-containing protein [Hyphomicrobiaceae bacterium]